MVFNAILRLPLNKKLSFDGNGEAIDRTEISNALSTMARRAFRRLNISINFFCKDLRRKLEQGNRIEQL
jgi:hypothetical protein